jgi:hypothetical protein
VGDLNSAQAIGAKYFITRENRFDVVPSGMGVAPRIARPCRPRLKADSNTPRFAYATPN